MVIPNLWLCTSSPLGTLNGAGRFDGHFSDLSSFLTEGGTMPAEIAVSAASSQEVTPRSEQQR
jgi:hypothetical protein